MSAEEDQARSLLATAGVGAPHVAQLAKYVGLVLEANRKFNLTGARSVEQLVPHILDSLTVVPYVRPPYVDVGSGAGLPGIPVAIVTGVRTVLLESTAKKAAFLKDVLVALGVVAEVVPARAEDVGRRPDLRGQFASGTVRAIASAPTALELIAPLLAINGVAILQRGTMGADERAALAGAAMMLGCAVDAEIALEGERRLVLVRKVSPTSDRYPRRSGVPEKRPLCG